MKKKFLSYISVFIFYVILLEIFLSLIFSISASRNPLELSKTTADFPYVYYTFSPKKNNGVFLINKDGLYSPYNREKAKGVLRVVLIGGSLARGANLEYNKTIAYNLEEVLRAEFPEKKIEVVNAGMSAYVAEQVFIYYQLVISKYNPDIVVGLGGCNDLISAKLNRHSGLYTAPQNMEQFMVIKQGKEAKTFFGRIPYIFPNIFKAATFIKAGILKSRYDYSGFNEEQMQKAASDYVQIINDIDTLCRARGIGHLEFLQPIKWYVKGNKEESIKKGAVPKLFDLYQFYEKELSALNFVHSLTDLSADPKIFGDECHLCSAGNREVALKMSSYIKKLVK